jgi:hypothetical protein
LLWESKQSKIVEVEQTALFDFGMIPVVLFGPGNFSATFSRTGTYGELIFLYFRGFGLPNHDINIARTPVTMEVKSSVEEPWSIGFIMYGVISSSEPTPYMYNIKLDF